MSAGVFAGLLILLTACASPAAPLRAEPPPADSLPLHLELAPRYEVWRGPLLQEWHRLSTRFPRIASRWSPSCEAFTKSLRLVVPADGSFATQFYRDHNLQGNPMVPRTFMDRALAVVPLPRDDALLAELPGPPQTWLHSFRHECAHLLSLQYPDLRAAPSWFQEGFAELWCVADAGGDGRLHPLPHQWPFWGTVHRWWPQESLEDTSTPGEVRYAAYAARVAAALADNSGPTPWQNSSWAINRVGASTPFYGLRGRHAYWDVSGGHYLVASRPLQRVELDLPALWNGSAPLDFELQLGRSRGQVEAGILLMSAEQPSSPRIRLRYGLGGGVTAYVEQGASPGYEAFALANEHHQLGRKRTVHLWMEGATLKIQVDSFQRQFPLQELGIKLPLRLRMVVRDGAFAFRTQ